jgi:hypothetical protein
VPGQDSREMVGASYSEYNVLGSGCENPKEREKKKRKKKKGSHGIDRLDQQTLTPAKISCLAKRDEKLNKFGSWSDLFTGIYVFTLK